VTADLRRAAILVDEVAEAKRLNCHTPASHLTQGDSNEAIPVKQCGCFKNKAACFSHINWDMPFPTRANADARNLSAKPRQMRLGHLHPAN
jgi:hypothetical protein